MIDMNDYYVYYSKLVRRAYETHADTLRRAREEHGFTLDTYHPREALHAWHAFLDRKKKAGHETTDADKKLVGRLLDLTNGLSQRPVLDEIFNRKSVPSVTVPLKGSTPGIPDQGALSRPFGRAGHAPRSQDAVSVADLTRPDPMSWVVKDVIPEASATMLYGMGGSLKSILAVHLAMHVAAGRDKWMGYAVDPTNVLYLDFELDWQVQGNRMYDVAAGMGLDGLPDGLFYLSAQDMDTRTAMQKALDTCAYQGIGLLVLDSVGWAIQGDSEASSDVLTFLNNYVQPFEAEGIAPLLLDHVAKTVKGINPENQLPFGSVYKFNKCRSVWQAKGDPDDAGVSVTLAHKKSNFGPLQDAYVARATFAKGQVNVGRTDLDPQVDSGEPTTADLIMDALAVGPKYPDELVELLDVERQTVKNQLSKLRGQGKIENTGKKQGQSHQVRLAPEYDPNSLLANEAAQEATESR
jgi:DNA-binding transcriptional ArsR family regulator